MARTVPRAAPSYPAAGPKKSGRRARRQFGRAESCSDEVLRTEKEQTGRKGNGGARERRRFLFCVLRFSVSGERRGIRFDRRLSAHRRFGRLGLLLIPFDRLPPAPPGPPPTPHHSPPPHT